MVIIQRQTPQEAYQPLVKAYPPIIPFRDVTQSKCNTLNWSVVHRRSYFTPSFKAISTYNLTILDCIRGISKAMFFGFHCFNSFDAEEYVMLTLKSNWKRFILTCIIHRYLAYERVENGDLNWIIPEKFLAFKSPSDVINHHSGYIEHTPEVSKTSWIF